MTLFVWPYRLLTPATQQTVPDGASQEAGRSLSGWGQTADFSGGGFWTSTLGNISLFDQDRILAARAWSAHLRGGARSFIMPCWDLGFAPRPWAGGASALGGLPALADDGDWFGWEPSFGEPIMVAGLAGAVALSGVEMAITLTRGAGLKAGQHFSLHHDVWGWRMYRIERIVSRSGNTAECLVWPPGRESIAAGASVELDVPRCEMKLASGQSIEPVIRGGRMAEAISATFVENRPNPST